MKYYLFALACLFSLSGFASSAHATVYYVDFATTTSGTGTSKDLAFRSLNEFTNVARSAGDVAFVRRGQATTTGIATSVFSSDGTLNKPIVVSADYDNIWGANASSTQTYELKFGSTTMTASANQSDIEVGEWIYVNGDCYERGVSASTLNPCEFAYEVSAVSSTSISLYLPYKGTKTSTGNELRIMPKAPIIGSTAEATQISLMSADDNWTFKGLDFRSTNSGCIIDESNETRAGSVYFDMVLATDATTACGISSSANSQLQKTRFSGGNLTLETGGGIPVVLSFRDVYADCGGAFTLFTGVNTSESKIDVRNVIISNCTNGLSSAPGLFTASNVQGFNGDIGTVTATRGQLFLQDLYGQPNVTMSSGLFISSDTAATTTTATTSNLRAGGGPLNLLTFPPSGTGNTGVSTAKFPLSYIKLFEYPIYADTSSKTYTVYFNSTSTAQWTANPTTSSSVGSSTPELFIECEYYGTTDDADRYLKRSNTASDVDFAASTAWQDISVTCQPTQSGVLYLRGWYGKPKETGGNIFFMDTTPVVS